jgi:hypothetical protein
VTHTCDTIGRLDRSLSARPGCLRCASRGHDFRHLA